MKLILHLNYGGLGDHLFYSPIPRIAKQFNSYNKVYISNSSNFRNPDIKRLVWDLNPYVDGFIDEEGICLPDFTEVKEDENIIGAIARKLNLTSNTYFIEPEVYYKPKFVAEYNFKIYDPNFVSYVGSVSKIKLNLYFMLNGIWIDKELKELNANAKKLWFKKGIVSCKSIFDYCDLIYSAKEFYCLTSGGATLAASINKNCKAFYGNGQKSMFHHSKSIKYIKI